MRHLGAGDGVVGRAAELDHLTGGRVELGIGAGHSFTEYDAIGETFDPPAVRKARLAEHPDLTLTRLYNALEAHRAGGELVPVVDAPPGDVDVDGHVRGAHGPGPDPQTLTRRRRRVLGLRDDPHDLGVALLEVTHVHDPIGDQDPTRARGGDVGVECCAHSSP